MQILAQPEDSEKKLSEPKEEVKTLQFNFTEFSDEEIIAAIERGDEKESEIL